VPLFDGAQTGHLLQANRQVTGETPVPLFDDTQTGHLLQANRQVTGETPVPLFDDAQTGHLLQANGGLLVLVMALLKTSFRALSGFD
jgi:hypothetical protein